MNGRGGDRASAMRPWGPVSGVVVSLAWLLLSVAHAGEVRLDFEALETDLPLGADVSDVSGDASAYVEEGYVVRDLSGGPGLWRYGTPSDAWQHRRSTAVFNTTVWGTTELARVDGLPFRFVEVTLVELDGPYRAPVTFVGERPDGTIVMASARTDGIAYGGDIVRLPATFGEVVAVRWHQEPPFHQFDDLIVDGPPILDVDVTCPGGGRAEIAWGDVAPGGEIALVRGRPKTVGSVVPGGACAGTPLEVDDARLLQRLPSDRRGEGFLEGFWPAVACDGALQLLDLTDCRTSPAVALTP